MVFQADIWRLAGLIIRKYGPEACEYAHARIESAVGDGDLDRQQVWQRIREAVAEIARAKPRPGETFN